MDARARHAQQLTAIRQAVLDGDGVTSRARRASAAAGERADPPLESYLAKVRDASYRITDRDVAALKTAGVGEEEIFELTIATALGAALRRFDAGMRAMGEGEP